MSENAFDAVRALVNQIRAKANLEPVGGADGQEQPSVPVCEKCGGTGMRWLGRDKDGYSWSTPCDCSIVAANRQRIEDSGLSELLADCTFDSFMTREPFQREMARTAAAWVEAVKAGKKPWFFIGGQSGCGKTHICTAACGKLMDAGIDVRYMQWLTEARQLKANVNDSSVFQSLLRPFVDVSVLYIDDLLKPIQGAQPTTADGNVAFEILKGRCDRRKPTIISSERSIAELMGFDEATFSRVRQQANGFVLNIAADGKKNFRLA